MHRVLHEGPSSQDRRPGYLTDRYARLLLTCLLQCSSRFSIKFARFQFNKPTRCNPRFRPTLTLRNRLILELSTESRPFLEPGVNLQRGCCPLAMCEPPAQLFDITLSSPFPLPRLPTTLPHGSPHASQSRAPHNNESRAERRHRSPHRLQGYCRSCTSEDRKSVV